MKIEDVTMNEFNKLVKWAEKILTNASSNKNYYKKRLDSTERYSDEWDEAIEDNKKAQQEFDELTDVLYSLGFRYERNTDDDGEPKYTITDFVFWE